MRIKSRLRSALERVKRGVRRRHQLLDLAISIAIIPGVRLLKQYRIHKRNQWPRTQLRLKDMGLYPIVDRYYEPLFNHRNLRHPLSDDRRLPGIDLNEAAQLEFLRNLSFGEELVAMDLAQEQPFDSVLYSIRNNFYLPGDADFLYQFLRHTKPNKVIEIGSGHSTKIARVALRKNRDEGGPACKHICIEPYATREAPWLEKMEDIEIVRKPVEECDLDWAKELGPEDLLFIDSSHIIRPQGDVLYEYQEILPQLQAGVYIHIHDIFTPKDYPEAWVVDNVWFWNEQYLLEVLLTNTARYEVVAALNFLQHRHQKRLGEVCPYLTPEHGPAAFYMRVVG